MKYLKTSETRRELFVHCLIATILFMLVAFFAEGVKAQDPTPVTVPAAGNETDARSPSITSLVGTNNLVCAYVVTENNLPRVHVATSTNDGSTWTDNGAPDNDNVPSFITKNSAGCLDDPQIVAISQYDLTLVAHGYDQDSYKGAYAGDGSYVNLRTLFTTAGIYYTHSTNGGVTWTAWKPIFETPGGANLETVDHPRMALRRDYADWVNDVPACVVWEQRSFSQNSDGTIAGSNITTKIGMAFFNDGSIYSPGGTNYYSGIETESSLDAGQQPERPSVAVAPDGQIWLSYYTISDWSQGTNGDDAHDAHFYVQSGTVAFAGSNATPSFTTTNLNQIVSGEIPIGNYDPNRGYFFNGESGLHSDFNVEFDQGPSVQVAISNIYQCVPTYTVGLAYGHADTHYSWSQWGADESSNPDVNRWLAFWYASVPFGALPQNVTWNEQDKLDAGPIHGGSNYSMALLPILAYCDLFTGPNPPDDPADKVSSSSGTGTPGRGANRTMSVDLQREASYFVLNYVHAERCSSRLTLENNFTNAEDRTGFTFDNTFGTGSIFQTAEIAYDNSCKNIGIDLSPFGTQVGACGEQGDLEVHTAWHHLNIGDGSPDDQLFENNGGAIIALAYLDGYPYNDLNAYPSMTGLPYYYFNYDHLGQPSSLLGPSTYSSPTTTEGISAGLGNFVFNQFFPTISTNPVAYGEYLADYTADPNSGKTDFGILNTSNQRKIVTTENIAHAVFEKSGVVYYSEGMPNKLTGDGSEREWTQPIAIGGIPSGITQTLPSIAVYEEDAEDAVRTAEEKLGITPISELPTYQQNAPDMYNGLSSIAISWTELTPVIGTSTATAAIKIRTREFNVCTGQWFDWGPIQTLYESPAGVAYETSETCDGVSAPIPVSTVAPLAYPPLTVPTRNPTAWGYNPDPDINISNSYYTFLPTNLIGWVTTWSDDLGDYDGVLLNGVQIRSKTLLRPAVSGVITNANWGTYGAVDPNDASVFQPTGINTSNVIYNNTKAQTVCSDFIPYISSTSEENKAEDSMVASPHILVNQNPPGYKINPRAGNYQIDVAFSTSDGYYYDGGYSYGILTGSTQYGTSSTNYGVQLVPTPGSNLQLYGSHAASPLPSTVWAIGNDPDITVNSSGQQFMAWEEMGTTYGVYSQSGTITPPGYYSSINVQNTYYEGSWLKNGISNPITTFDESLPSARPLWTGMRDPSIAGEPKTMAMNFNPLNSSDPNITWDQDLGEVQLMFWQKNDASGNSVNYLHRWYYTEDQGVPGVPNSITGDGGWQEFTTNPYPTGENPQTSFSTFTFNSEPGLMLANQVSSPDLFSTPWVGSYKLGVFGSTQDFAEYRSEGRAKDSAEAKFVWGDAYVTEPGDSTGEQIKLAYNIDTAGWQSHDELRDSLFRTQCFELDLGATVSYFRGGFIEAGDSLAAVNSFVQQDTMRYYIEMVHSSGHIDTLERLVYAPGTRAYITPGTIHTQPSLLQTDTVYLRVTGSVSGFSDLDSLCQFANEIDFGHYTSLIDSTLAMKTVAPFVAPSQSTLQVMDVYPNPIAEQGSKATVILSCPKGLAITISVVSATGEPMGAELAEQGTGTWQTYSIPVPATDGDYFIRISDGIDSKVLPISVLH